MSRSSRAAFASTRVGAQPSSVQVPPGRSRSTSATRAPSSAARSAAVVPAGPPPMTIRSKRSTRVAYPDPPALPPSFPLVLRVATALAGLASWGTCDTLFSLLLAMFTMASLGWADVTTAAAAPPTGRPRSHRPFRSRTCPYTGFMIDSETGNPFGGGSYHDHFPSTFTGARTQNEFTLTGSGWSFYFGPFAPLAEREYVDGQIQFRVNRSGQSCSSADWKLRVLESPVIVDGIVTRFAVDFWRNRCGISDPGAAMYGTLRIGSSISPSLLHVTSRLDFPDTFAVRVRRPRPSRSRISASRPSMRSRWSLAGRR